MIKNIATPTLGGGCFTTAKLCVAGLPALWITSHGRVIYISLWRDNCQLAQTVSAAHQALVLMDIGFS